MAIRGLESTFIYSHLNKSNSISTNITSLLNKGITLDKSNLEEAILIIMKNYKFPLKFKVMEAFENGDIILKYGHTSKLPTCLPFFLTKINNKVVAVVSVDVYGTIDTATDYVTIDPKKLYCMMEGAYLARLIYFNNTKIGNRTAIISNGSAIYSMMFARVLNKKYALNVDKTKFHKVLFLASKFFIINVLGNQDSEMVFNYAIKNCPNGNIYSLKEVDSMFNPKYFESLDKFIAGLVETKGLGLNLKDLTVRGYLEAFINMYDSANLLSLESFPYFVYNVVAVTNGAYINNQYALEEIVDNAGAKIYVDLLQLDKS